MRLARIPALSVAAIAALAALSTTASARPDDNHRHKVCHVVHDHGHAKKVCNGR